MTHYVIMISRLIRAHSGPHDGGKYDMSAACPQCGTGVVRIDPIFMAPSTCKDGVAATYKLQILVSRRIFDLLSALGIKGLQQAVHKTTREPISFWNLAPTATLPAWSDESHGFCTSKIAPPCTTCHRDGFFDITKKDLHLVYDSSCIPLFRDHDILATWEHFGTSRLRSPFQSSVFAAPRVIVSNRIKDAIDNERGVQFIPVTIKKPNK